MELTEEEREQVKGWLRRFKTKEKSIIDETIPVTQQEAQLIKREFFKDGCERIK